jgi:CheY-like chemotaxis protein
MPVSSEVKEMTNWSQPGVLKSKSILVAEDDNTNFFLLKEYLQLSEAFIIWAQNGLQAYEKCKENKNIDIVLMDIQMPVLNGFDSMKKIKAEWQEIPIVALTAYAMSGDREKGLEAGFDEYLSKPVSRKILMETILRYI